MITCLNIYCSRSSQMANKEKSFFHFSRNFSGGKAIEVNEILKM